MLIDLYTHVDYDFDKVGAFKDDSKGKGNLLRIRDFVQRSR